MARSALCNVARSVLCNVARSVLCNVAHSALDNLDHSAMWPIVYCAMWPVVYSAVLLNLRNLEHFQAAFKSEHYCQITSIGFLHANPLKNFACNRLSQLVTECLLLMTIAQWQYAINYKAININLNLKQISNYI